MRAGLIKEAVVVASKVAAIEINTTARCRKATRKKRSDLREAVSTILGGEIIHALSQQIDLVRRLAGFLEPRFGRRKFISQLVYDFGEAVGVNGDVVDVLSSAYSSDDVGSRAGFCRTDIRECRREEDDGEKEKEKDLHERKREWDFSLFWGIFVWF